MPSTLLQFHSDGGARGTSAAATSSSDRSAYETWKRTVMGCSTEPLAIDPVISSQQTDAEFQRKRRSYMATLDFAGPTKSRQAGVFLGKYVLAKRGPTGGVALYLEAWLHADSMGNCTELQRGGI